MQVIYCYRVRLMTKKKKKKDWVLGYYLHLFDCFNHSSAVHTKADV